MSIKIMSLTWELDLKSTDKLVLLALADHSNDDGECYPSLSKIGAKCGLSKQGLVNVLKRLQNEGFLSVENRQSKNGANTSNLYKLTVDGSQRGLLGVVNEVDKGSQRGLLGVVNEVDKQYKYLNRHVESSINHEKMNKKDFTFSLGKNIQYPNLTEEYKERLLTFCLLHDQGVHFQAFVDYCLEKAKGYADWSAAYRSWCRNDYSKLGVTPPKLETVMFKDNEVEAYLVGEWLIFQDKKRIKVSVMTQEHSQLAEPINNQIPNFIQGRGVTKI